MDGERAANSAPKKDVGRRGKQEEKETAKCGGKSKSVRCVSPDWGHSARNTDYMDEVDEWDLWEVNGASAKDFESGPEPQFDFQPPATDAFRKENRVRRNQWKDRKLVKTLHGSFRVDCRGLHRIDTMCMFCDGRRGDWASTKAEKNFNFQMYQESFVKPIQPKVEDPGADSFENFGLDDDDEETGKESFKQFVESEGRKYSETELREKFYRQLSFVL